MQRQNPRRTPAAIVALAALILVLAASVTVLLGSRTPAGAVSSFLQAFGVQYPDAAGSRIGVCLLCHTSPLGGESLNPYGADLGEDLAFRAVENIDSDGDGYTNLQEIRALTFPGDPADNPLTVVTTTTVPGGTTTSTLPGSGGALYAQNCAGCHGAAGGNLIPTILSRTQLISVITGGMAGMPGFSGSLAAAQIGSIADTLLAWSQTTTTTAPGGSTTTAPAGSGGSVYASYCASCHGAGGGNLVGRGLTSSRVAAVVASGTAGMPGFSGTLSSAQISAVAGYVAAVSATTTAPGGSTTTAASAGAGLFGTYCASCHGSGGGNLVGRGLSAAQIAAVTASGTAGMPGFSGTLSAADINAIAGYVAALGATTTTAAGGTSTTTTSEADGGTSTSLGSTSSVPAGATTTLGAHGPVEGGGTAWWVITLAAAGALIAVAAFSFLLFRSSRHVFRS